MFSGNDPRPIEGPNSTKWNPYPPRAITQVKSTAFQKQTSNHTFKSPIEDMLL